MSVPYISVIMGVLYKNEDIEPLRRSVLSILKQGFSDFEFLICDDGSNLKAKQLLDDLANKDSRIRLIRKGDLFILPNKLNACLKVAKGELVARMDDDDYSHPERFEKQIQYLKSHEEISFVGCNVNLQRNKQMVGEKRFPEFPQVSDFYFTQPFIHPTLIFRKEDLLKVGGYSEEKHCVLCEDYDLLLRLYSNKHRGANLQEMLFDYTIPNTAKGSRKMKHRWNESVTRYLRFKELKIVHKTIPYIVKPLLVGFIPENLLAKLKGL